LWKPENHFVKIVWKESKICYASLCFITNFDYYLFLLSLINFCHLVSIKFCQANGWITNFFHFIYRYNSLYVWFFLHFTLCFKVICKSWKALASIEKLSFHEKWILKRMFVHVMNVTNHLNINVASRLISFSKNCVQNW